MGISTALLTIHDDTMHTGSAMRNVANGLAGLDASVYVPLALLSGITNTQIAAAAAIAKTKLASLDVVNADVNAAAAIAGTKLEAGWQKNVASGIAGLSAGALVPDAQNPAVNTTHIAAAAPHSGHSVILGAARLIWVGNGTDNRAIPHGLGRKPVFAIWHGTGSNQGIQENDTTQINFPTSNTEWAVTAWDATNIYVSGTVGKLSNVNTASYYAAVM